MEKISRSERKAQVNAQRKAVEIKKNVDLTQEQYLEIYNKELKFAREEIAAKKEKTLDIVVAVFGIGAVATAMIFGFGCGAKYMDKMICKGAMKGGIHKNLKNGGRIICKYISKEELAEVAKEVTKEAVKG